MKAELKKFQDYESEMEFCKKVFNLNKKQYILIIGAESFVNDILLNIGEDNIDFVITDKDIKSTNKKCNYCLLEEDDIKKLSDYKDRIINKAYILSNKDEKMKIFDKSSIEDMSNDNSEDIKGYNLTKQYEIASNEIVDRYLDISYYVTDEDKKRELLTELFAEGYYVGVMLDRLQIAQELADGVTNMIENQN
ncbi:hypothetical protein ACFHWD_04000 [Clostridium sp. MT-14]|uniref:hypothetical protein n=1 Tax=Clostridium sp. MT-14 TaxID=3348360 RepID=UPI0035F2D88D